MTVRLLIRLDSGSDIGHGHAVRVEGLLAQIRTAIEPIVLGRVENLPGLLANAEVHEWAGDDPNRQLKSIRELRPDAILVDLPARSERPWQRFRQAGVAVIAIDDEGGDIDADMIINGTAYDEFHRYCKRSPEPRYLIGPSYALIRPQFAASPWRNPQARRLAVIVGSGERARAWVLELVNGGLDGVALDSIDLVVGASFPDPDALRRGSEKRNMAIKVHQGLDARRLAELMSNSTAALMTGGMIVYEALAVGLPAAVFPNVANLIPEVNWFATHGYVRDLGYEAAMDMERVRANLVSLLSDRDAAIAQSVAGKQLVDGLGMQRVAKAIDELLAA